MLISDVLSLEADEPVLVKVLVWLVTLSIGVLWVTAVCVVLFSDTPSLVELAIVVVRVLVWLVLLIVKVLWLILFWVVVVCTAVL